MTDLTESPFLGSIGLSRRRPGSPNALVVEASPGSRTASAYRLLATEIEYSRSDDEHPVASVLVTGSGVDEGVGELAANLAAAFARSGRSVLLLDADDAGEATRLLGLDKARAETAGDAKPVRRVPSRFRSAFTPSLEVVPQGTPGTGDMTDRQQVEELLGRLLESHELVVVTTAPALDSSAALTWARVADCAILAAMRERTKRTRVADGVESLRLVNANLVGTVLTESRFFDRFGRKGKGPKPNQRTWAMPDGAAQVMAAVPADGAEASSNGPGRAVPTSETRS
jgi:Mrp family chromosome partitioning ATPase